MEVQRHLTSEAFRAAAWDFLLTAEAQNCFTLAVTSPDTSTITTPPTYMATVTNGASTRDILGAGIMAPGGAGLLLTSAPIEAALLLLADALHSGVHFDVVTAPEEVATACAEELTRRRGTAWARGMTQLVYSAASVRLPPDLAPVPGKLEQATDRDISLVADFAAGFERDVGMPGPHPPSEQFARRRILNGSLYLWKVAGEAVSMVGYSGITPHGIRINAVYTPPEQRGKGYATACVAALAAWLLREYEPSRRFVFLFADAANAASNRVYTRVGFELVGAQVQFVEARVEVGERDAELPR